MKYLFVGGFRVWLLLVLWWLDCLCWGDWFLDGLLVGVVSVVGFVVVIVGCISGGWLLDFRCC